MAVLEKLLGATVDAVVRQELSSLTGFAGMAAATPVGPHRWHRPDRHRRQPFCGGAARRAAG